MCSSDLQDNNAQWHIERTNTKKVNAVTESNNEERIAKVDELLSALKHKNEVHVNAITNAQIEEIYFIACNTYNPAWKNSNYGQNYQKPYNPAGTSNNSNYNNGETMATARHLKKH